MIEYVKGELAELTPTYAVVDCGGVGYLLNISLNTYTALQGRPRALLYAYEALREDAHVLFGFATKDERTLFLLLIGVSGIGGQSARMILSAFTPVELCGIVTSGDERLLRSVKGIGPKAAQRIIVDLKDKLAKLPLGQLSPEAGGAAPAVPDTAAVEESSSALVMLGFPPAAVRKTVLAIVKDAPEATVEQIIKQALKML